MDRLDILSHTGMIDENVAVFVKKIRRRFMDQYDASEDMTEMMLTHLAMATQRIINNESMEYIDETLFETIKKNDNFQLAEQFLKIINESSMVEYPDSEKHYLLLHLCNLINL